MSQQAFVRLLQQSGKEKKAVALQIDLCIAALKNGGIESAQQHLTQIKILMRSLGGAVVEESWRKKD